MAHDIHVGSHAERGTNGEVEELSKRKKRLLKSKCDYRDVQIKKQGVRMIDKDNEDMHRLMNELTPHVENEFNKDSPSICCGRNRSKYPIRWSWQVLGKKHTQHLAGILTRHIHESCMKMRQDSGQMLGRFLAKILE